MRRLALFCILVLFLCAPRGYAQSMMLLGTGNSGSPVSNQQLATPVTCGHASGTLAYNCTITATVGGELLVVKQYESDVNNAAITPTDNIGTCTWNLDYGSSNTGRFSTFSCVNAPAGITTVTLQPGASSPSMGIVYTMTGAATASAFDTNSAAYVVTSTNLGSNPAIAGSQNVASFGCTWNTVRASPGLTNYGVWSAVTTSAQGSNSLSCSYILNGKWGQYVYHSLSTNNDAWTSFVDTYKSAVVGTVPSGNLPTQWSNFENGNDGDVLTAAILNAGTLGGGCTWSAPAAGGFKVATAGSLPIINNVTVNGTTYTSATANTRGIQYDMGDNGITSACNLPADLSSASATVTNGFDIKTGTTDAGVWSGVSIVGAAAADYVIFNITNGLFVQECKSGSGTLLTGSSTAAANTAYKGSIKYVRGGTHLMNVYDTSGASLATFSCAATGTTNIHSASIIGNNHAGTGTVGNLVYVDNLQIDYKTPGAFPLIP